MKIICVIVCKYLNKSKNEIYYKMLASDTFCNTFARDKGYQKHIFLRLIKNKPFLSFLFLIIFYVTFWYFLNYFCNKFLFIFSVIVITIMITRCTNVPFYCGIIFFISSISFLTFYFPLFLFPFTSIFPPRFSEFLWRKCVSVTLPYTYLLVVISALFKSFSNCACNYENILLLYFLAGLFSSKEVFFFISLFEFFLNYVFF